MELYQSNTTKTSTLSPEDRRKKELEEERKRLAGSITMAGVDSVVQRAPDVKVKELPLVPEDTTTTGSFLDEEEGEPVVAEEVAQVEVEEELSFEQALEEARRNTAQKLEAERQVAATTSTPTTGSFLGEEEVDEDLSFEEVLEKARRNTAERLAAKAPEVDAYAAALNNVEADEEDDSYWTSFKEWATGENLEGKDMSFIEGTDLKAGTYGESDILKDAAAMATVRDFMSMRQGDAYLEGKDDSEILDDFLDKRRGVRAGNSISVTSELSFVLSNKDDKDKMVKMQKAMALHDNMAGLFNTNVSLKDKANGVFDWVRVSLLDPMNLLAVGTLGTAKAGTVAASKGIGAATGKVVSKATGKVAAKSTAKQIGQLGSQAIVRQAQKEAIKKGTTQAARKEIFAQEVASLSIKKSQDIATNYAAKQAYLASTPAWRRMFTTEAAQNIGLDALYAGAAGAAEAKTLEIVNEEDIDLWQVGLTSVLGGAIGSVAITGAFRGGQAMLRGKVGPKALEVSAQTPADVVSKLADAVEDYAAKPGSKLNGGNLVDRKEAGKIFNDIILGIADKDGNIEMKGMATLLQEGNLRVDVATGITNWTQDVLSKANPSDIRRMSKALGLEGAEDMTASKFAKAFKDEVTKGARAMNSMSQLKRSLEIDSGALSDLMTPSERARILKQMGIEDELAEKGGPLGTRILKGTLAGFAGAQNRAIRSMVSSVSTSMRNIKGYAGVTIHTTVTDVVEAALLSGRTVWRAAFMNWKGAGDSLNQTKHLLGSAKDRAMYMVDPEMTKDTFIKLSAEFPTEMKPLTQILTGGVDDVSTPSLTGVGNVVGGFDTFLDGVGRITLVNAQDILTKSHSFMTAINRNMRQRYGMSWAEFVDHPDVDKMVNTAEFREMLVDSVETTANETFSRSFVPKPGDDAGMLQKTAGWIEEFRKVPVLGMTIPFGRFMASSVHYVANGTGLGLLGPHWLRRGIPKGYDGTTTNQAARLIATTGLIASAAHFSMEKTEKGYGIFEYEDPATGELKDSRYDYPANLVMAMGHIAAKESQDLEVTSNDFKEIFEDGIGLNAVTGSTGMVAKLKRDIEDWDSMGLDALTDPGSAIPHLFATFFSSFTRFAEPADAVASLFSERGLADYDRNQYVEGRKADFGVGTVDFGAPMWNETLKYVDSIVDVATSFSTETVKGGERRWDPEGVTLVRQPDGSLIEEKGGYVGGDRTTPKSELVDREVDYKVTGAGAPNFSSVNRLFGSAPVEVSNTARLFRILGIEGYQEEEKAKQRALSPRIANEINRQTAIAFEAISTDLLKDPKFRNGTMETKQAMYKERVEGLRSRIKTKLKYSASNPEDKASNIALDLSDKYSKKEIREAMTTLKLRSNTLENLSELELYDLMDYLRKREALERLSR